MSIRTKRNSRRFIAAAAAVAVAASTFATTSPASATATVAATRVAGADRYGTSVAIATATTTATAGRFVIASGDNYPDALAASALAGARDARIVLVPSSGALSVGALTLLAGATEVFIIGGTGAVSTALETNLTAARPLGAGVAAAAITRVSGATRYETAAAVSAAVAANSGTVGTVGLKRTAILVSGENFADAVAAAPLAYRGPASQAAVHPIFLTQPASLNASTAQRLIAMGIQQVVIVGGTSAVSAAVATAVEALGVDVVRVAGANRYDTAAALAAVATTAEAAGGFGWPKTAAVLVNLAPAGGGADALGASSWLGKNPRVLLGSDGSSTLPAATAAFLDTNKATIAGLTVFGGTAAVPAAAVDAALVSAGKTAAPTVAVTVLEGDNKASITFAEAVTKASAEDTSSYAVFSSVGGEKNLSMGVYNATTRTVVLTLTGGASFAAGDTVRVVSTSNAGVVTSDGRKIAQSDTVVTLDTTPAVATVTALIGTNGGSNDTFVVSFNKLVTTVGAVNNASFQLNGVNLTINPTVSYRTGTTVTGPSSFNTMVVQFSGQSMAAGNVVTIKKDIVTILGAAADGATAALVRNAAASATAIADAVKPAVSGAPTVKTTSTNAFLTVGAGNASITVVADKATSSGVPGNKYSLVVTTGATPATTTVAATTVTVTLGANPVITVTLAQVSDSANPTTTISATAASVALAINSNAVASTLVTATAGGTGLGNLDTLVSLALAGGTEAHAVTVTWSEAVSLTAVSGTVTYSAKAGSTDSRPAAAATGLTVLATSGLAVTYTFVVGDGLSIADAQALRPVVGVSQISADAGVVRDLGANPSAAVAPRLIAAG